jgi:hypothetical protein
MVTQIKISKKNYDELLRAERAFHDLHADLDKLENCGIDCTVMRDGIAQQLAQIAALKQNFAPDSVR